MMNKKIWIFLTIILVSITGCQSEDKNSLNDAPMEESLEKTIEVDGEDKTEEQKVSEMFVLHAEKGWTMVECASVYDLAYDCVGIVLFKEDNSDYIKVAYLDKSGHMQQCGVEAYFEQDSDLKYHGNGVVTFNACTKDGEVHIFKITFSRNEENVNFVLEQEELQNEDMDAYIASVKEQSDGIRDSLENEVLTQADMNVKAQELYELWDGALNDLWSEVKMLLSDEEFTKLLDEQRAWIAEKEEKVAEAGKEVEGGSLYPLVVNGEAARITEERVYVLYDLYKVLNEQL